MKTIQLTTQHPAKHCMKKGLVLIKQSYANHLLSGNFQAQVQMSNAEVNALEQRNAELAQLEVCFHL